jgi:hypothetical protein
MTHTTRQPPGWTCRDHARMTGVRPKQSFVSAVSNSHQFRWRTSAVAACEEALGVISTRPSHQHATDDQCCHAGLPRWVSLLLALTQPLAGRWGLVCAAIVAAIAITASVLRLRGLTRRNVEPYSTRVDGIEPVDSVDRSRCAEIARSLAKILRRPKRSDDARQVPADDLLWQSVRTPGRLRRVAEQRRRGRGRHRRRD